MKLKVIIPVAAAIVFLFVAIASTAVYVSKHKGIDAKLTTSSLKQNKSGGSIPKLKNNLDFSKHAAKSKGGHYFTSITVFAVSHNQLLL